MATKGESVLRDLFIENALPVWLHDHATGRILAVNEAAANFYGLRTAELIGAPLDVLVPDREDRQKLARTTSSSFIDGGTHLRRNGTPVRVEVNVQESSFGGREARMVVVVDVTERLRAEDQLVKSERLLKEAQEIAHVGSFEWELTSDSVRWSDELYRIYGLEPQEFEATYAAFLDRIHPEDRDKVDATVRQAVQTCGGFAMEERIVRPDGTTRMLESRGHFIGPQQRLVGVCRDVTDLRDAERQRDKLAQLEREARQKAERARAEIAEILERITDAFVALDREWHYIYVNERAAQIFGRDRQSLIGRNIWTEFPEGADQAFRLACQKAMETQEPAQIESYYPPWGKWLETRIYPSHNGLAVYFQDVTERRRREDELRELSERLARTEEFSLVIVTVVTMDGHFRRVPPTFCRLLGYSEQELLSMNVERVIHPDDIEEGRGYRRKIIKGEAKSLDMELRLVTKGGATVWAYLNCSAVYDDAGTLTHFMVYLRDITERHRAEERIRYLALHDDLTELPNRVLFNDRLSQAIAHAHRLDSHLAVITLNLDDFKSLNDNFGHSFGDLVIRELAARLRASLRAADTIARLSGDEFAVIVQDLDDDDQAWTIASKLREAFQDPFEAGSAVVRVTCCMGASIYPRDGHDGETLFRNSESALSRAKEIGHDNVQLFDESMSARFRDRLVRQHELHVAVENHQLLAWYQPILRSSDGRIAGVEALARWNHPQRGIVGPDEFIPLAEETRLIVPIGESILRTACRDVRQWIERGHDLRLSVNLSVRQFQEMQLLHTIDSILAETRFDPARLEFEVTETVAMQNADLTMSILRELRERGIAIAIDDFGVGQSSMLYLRQFPINNIKIDKVFINDILGDATDAAIVRTIIDLAHTLRLSATAEGVESEAHARMLRDFGCDLLQGFHFSRPLPATELEAML